MNRLFSIHRHRARRGGFSLVEVVLAVSIVGVTFLAILGTLGVGITNDQTSSQQTIATNIAASIVADLRSTLGNVVNNGIYNPSATSTRYAIVLPTTLVTNPLAPLQGSTSTLMYFDNSGAFIPPVNPGSVPANANYVIHVYPAMISYVGPPPGGTSASQYSYMARINVAWPALAPVPAGNVDVITQYISH